MKFFYNILLLLSLNGISQQVTNLPAGEFEQRTDNKEVQLLDVRRAEEYKSGHVHGAFQADWTNRKQFEERVQYLDKTKPVYIYCLSGGRSAAAASWLTENGFTSVVNMEGGINAWKREGRKLEVNTAVQQMTYGEYDALLRSASLVLVDFGAEWCPPCKKMEPVLNALSKEHKELKVVKIDAGVHSDLMIKYKVEELPVFILYKSSREVWRRAGITGKEAFEKALQAAR